jgi:hypothetical protein
MDLISEKPGTEMLTTKAHKGELRLARYTKECICAFNLRSSCAFFAFVVNFFHPRLSGLFG